MTARGSTDLLALTEVESRRRRAIRRTKVGQSVQAGNTRALRYGVFAEIAVRDDVLDEIAMFYVRCPWLDPIRDGYLVESTARMAVRLRKLDDAIEAEGTDSQSLTSMYSRVEGNFTRNLEALGMTPRAAANLGILKLDGAERARRMASQNLEQYRPRPVVAPSPDPEADERARETREPSIEVLALSATNGRHGPGDGAGGLS